MPEGFRPAGPSVIIYFTDGSRTSLAEGSAGMHGRTLDQIQRIELHPVGGDILTGKRDDGVEVAVLAFTLPDLPFQVMAAIPKQDAKVLAEELGNACIGLVIAKTMPTRL